MSAIKPLHFYPPAHLFAKGAIGTITRYKCFSFIGQEGESLDLYRLIIRLRDGAYQVLHADARTGVELYTKIDCNYLHHAHIYVTGDWTIPTKIPDHFRRASTDSIDVPIP